MDDEKQILSVSTVSDTMALHAYTRKQGTAEATMVQIIVTAEQAKQLGESREPIEIVDQSGNRIGYYTQPFTNAEIAEAKRRSESEPGGRTTQEVLDRISKMESK